MAVVVKGSTNRHADTVQRVKKHAELLQFYLGEEVFQLRRVAGKKNTGTSMSSGTALAGLVEAGLPVSAAQTLRKRTRMSVKHFGHFIPRSTLESKRKSGEQTLSAEQSDRLMRLADTYARAAEVFGDHERAAKWMKRTNPQMPEGRTPEEMVRTSYGARHVEDVLTRLEHGIPA